LKKKPLEGIAPGDIYSDFAINHSILFDGLRGKRSDGPWTTVTQGTAQHVLSVAMSLADSLWGESRRGMR